MAGHRLMWECLYWQPKILYTRGCFASWDVNRNREEELHEQHKQIWYRINLICSQSQGKLPKFANYRFSTKTGLFKALMQAIKNSYSLLGKWRTHVHTQFEPMICFSYTTFWRLENPSRTSWMQPESERRTIFPANPDVLSFLQISDRRKIRRFCWEIEDISTAFS